jgi:hypothetical protein
MSKFVAREIFKFGIWIMFPICTLFLFNTPEVLNLFPTSSLSIIEQEMKEAHKNSYKLPKSDQEIDKQVYFGSCSSRISRKHIKSCKKTIKCKISGLKVAFNVVNKVHLIHASCVFLEDLYFLNAV